MDGLRYLSADELDSTPGAVYHEYGVLQCRSGNSGTRLQLPSSSSIFGFAGMGWEASPRQLFERVLRGQAHGTQQGHRFQMVEIRSCPNLPAGMPGRSHTHSGIVTGSREKYRLTDPGGAFLYG